MAEHYLYMDVIPLLTAEEAGGFSRAATRRRGVAVAATLCSSGEFRMFRQSDCRNLVEHLQAAKCVVGYNCIGFDYELIHGQVPFRRPKTIDLMRILVEAANRPVSLKDAVLGSLGDVGLSDCHSLFPISSPSDWIKVTKSLKQKLGILHQLHEHLSAGGIVELTRDGETSRILIPPGQLE
jgi:hypothetical protein